MMDIKTLKPRRFPPLAAVSSIYCTTNNLQIWITWHINALFSYIVTQRAETSNTTSNTPHSNHGTSHSFNTFLGNFDLVIPTIIIRLQSFPLIWWNWIFRLQSSLFMSTVVNNSVFSLLPVCLVAVVCFLGSVCSE